MTIQEIKQKINFRQPKYMLPAILYIPVMVTGYFILGFFSVSKAEVTDSRLQTTNYINDKLPDAYYKGDGIGGKSDNMKNSYGIIDDVTAVNNIERGGEDEKEEYESKYSEEELAQIQNEAEQRAEAEKQAERAKQKDAETPGQSAREKEALKELERALAEARLKGQMSVPSAEISGELSLEGKATSNNGDKQSADNKQTPKEVGKVKEEDGEQQVVKKVKTSSDYFNTLTTNEHEPNMIKAIIDENIKAVDGSRVRLRLLDDVEIGETMMPKGSYLYATMSGFGGQRVKGNVKSVLVGDEIIKINLAVYDTDGLEGLYIPSSNFRETSQDVASGAMSGSMNISSSSSGNSLEQWGINAAQNAYSKTTNAISKAIKKNRAKLKYGTFVYLINSKETKTK